MPACPKGCKKRCLPNTARRIKGKSCVCNTGRGEYKFINCDKVKVKQRPKKPKRKSRKR